MQNKNYFFLILFLSCSFQIIAQDIQINDSNSVNKDLYDWWQKDFSTSSVLGISLNQAYEVLKEKKSETIIVGVIDSGVDILHPDLKENIWVNTDEIAENGIDDDKNGYIDDINGWNFLVNQDNENVHYETFEFVRIARGDFENIKAEDVERAKKEYDDKKKSVEEESKFIENIRENFIFCNEYMQTYLDKESYTINDLVSKKGDSEQDQKVKEFLLLMMNQKFSLEKLEEYAEHNKTEKEYHSNIDFNPRGDFKYFEKINNYGNNDVFGGRADHGTHVAGIIGAIRNNDVGINGVAANVKIMSLRVVPDGDERDVDVANAIIYAVDNGAKIINMSFGKSYSVNKEKVDKAVLYAKEKGVLLICAAGNSAVDIDKMIHYPTCIIDEVNRADNWICVGASNTKKDRDALAYFSNYGKKGVNVFAPGMQIYSLQPNNNYKLNNGTSMAAPVVSGLAALLMSYYPDFDYKEIKDIIYQSSFKLEKPKVYIPQEGAGKKKKTKLKELSTEGGIVNAYSAVRLAESKMK